MSAQGFSKVKEVVAAWGQIRQLLRSGENGNLVPVVIPKDKRGFGFLFWFGLALLCFVPSLEYMVTGQWAFLFLGMLGTGVFAVLGGVSWWRSAMIDIEQGTVGIVSHYGKIETELQPGRHWLLWPWDKVEFIVNTATEIPYTAPVLSVPTKENVPLKSIEFFLKFQITNPVMFVQRIGATNFDVVLNSAVQDAIRQRTRQVNTERAYDLRGSNVEDMRGLLNKQMERYGVTITGANIPDVQLPDQYREHLSTREKVAKELAAYEKEWELSRKRKKDTIMMEIERAKKERDEKAIAVEEALNKAKEEVAQMLQEREAQAEKIRLDIEAKGVANLRAAENEARALTSLGKAYQDNQAVLQYELGMKGLEVAEMLIQFAPRPLLISSQGDSQSSPLATLVLAQALPKVMREAEEPGHGGRSVQTNGGVGAVAADWMNSLLEGGGDDDKPQK